ncbi:MAG: cysteine desulfurase family protein [Gemmatimonadota bacterium]
MVEAIYMDHAATTALRPEAREAMAPYLDARFGNPSSTHRWGREARGALEEARERVAAALGARRSEIVFTGGGTEADNIAILGRWRCARQDGARAVVCSAVEHKAILAAVQQAGREGAEVVLLAVDEHGTLDLDAVEHALVATPAVVSVMWGNNEVGTVQPVGAVAERCRAAGVVCHTDAVQAFGKVPVDVAAASVDLLSVSAHKIGGPKGIGALYVRDGVRVDPVCHGGGQERQLRPGTENVAGAVGFAAAAERAAAEQAAEAARLAALRDTLCQQISAAVPDVRVNGQGAAARLPHVLSLTFPDADQDAFLIGLDLEGLACSGASACQSGASAPSHVLSAMGGAMEASATIRLSFGHVTTAEEVARAAELVARVASRVRIAAPARG